MCSWACAFFLPCWPVAVTHTPEAQHTVFMVSLVLISLHLTALYPRIGFAVRLSVRLGRGRLGISACVCQLFGEFPMPMLPGSKHPTDLVNFHQVQASSRILQVHSLSSTSFPRSIIGTAASRPPPPPPPHLWPSLIFFVDTEDARLNAPASACRSSRVLRDFVSPR